MEARNLQVGQTILINGRNGKTQLNPMGNMVLEVNNTRSETIVTVHGWDGDFEIAYHPFEEVEFETL